MEDVKVSKTLFATVLGFVCLWMPALNINVMSLVEPSLPNELLFFSTFLVYSSSCANPFIYGFMNRAFKNEFKVSGALSDRLSKSREIRAPNPNLFSQTAFIYYLINGYFRFGVYFCEVYVRFQFFYIF